MSNRITNMDRTKPRRARFGPHVAEGKVSKRACAATAVVSFALLVAGCGSTGQTATNASTGGAVTVAVTAPTGGSVIAASNVVVRGTVSPSNATVQVQGRPAAVGNGVFTGTASLHGGRTTIDVIGSAADMSPGATSIVVSQPASPQPVVTVTPTVVEPARHTGSPVSGARTFQSPSGNITCAIVADGAQCSVVSASLTFVLPAGGPAYTTPGLSVPQGSGPVAPYGTTQTAGAVTCVIPPSSSPAGITCRSQNTGHGFQASRVTERQEVY